MALETLYEWMLKDIKFVLAKGDLFEAPVEALVNSEQTDFRLVNWGSGATVSQQLFERYDRDIQEQLNAQTGDAPFEAPKVLVTRHDDRFKRVFHLGFHMPGSGPTEADDLDAIGQGLRTVLLEADRSVASVAMPFIGTGLYGLPETLVIGEIFDSLLAHVARQRELGGHLKEVWLVVTTATDAKARDLVKLGVQRWLDHFSDLTVCEPLDFKVAFLDSFDIERIRTVRHPGWAAHLYVQLGEYLTAFLAAILLKEAALHDPPSSLQKGKKFAGFSDWLETGKKQATHSSEPPDAWAQLSWRAFKNHSDCLSSLKEKRNGIAHGEWPPDPGELRGQIAGLMSDLGWGEVAQQDDPSSQLAPWIELRRIGVKSSYGLFRRRLQNQVTEYLLVGEGRIQS